MVSIPLLLLGLLLLGIGGVSVYGHLFGRPDGDPFRWPEVEATVIGHRVHQPNSARRVLYAGGRRVRVHVLVSLPGGKGWDVAEVEPPGMRFYLTRPDGMSFPDFAACINELAVVEAQRLYPLGSTLMVVADPQRNSIGYVNGRFRIRAHCRATVGSKAETMLGLGFLMMAGTIFIFCGALLIWVAPSGYLR